MKSSAFGTNQAEVLPHFTAWCLCKNRNGVPTKTVNRTVINRIAIVGVLSGGMMSSHDRTRFPEPSTKYRLLRFTRVRSDTSYLSACSRSQMAWMPPAFPSSSRPLQALNSHARLLPERIPGPASHALVTGNTVLFFPACDSTDALGQKSGKGAIMTNRILVPANARMLQVSSNGRVENSAGAARTELLVPRHLIPANARMPQAKPSEATGDSGTRSQRDLGVRRALVPANAQMDRTPNQAGTANTQDAAAQHNLFDLHAAFLDEAWSTDVRKPVDWLISLGIHFAVVAVVMMVPLFLTQAIDLSHYTNTYLVSPTLGAPLPPGPPPPPAAAVRPQQAPRTQNLTATRLIAPIAIPKAVQMPRSIEEPSSEGAMGVPGGVVGGVPGGEIGGILGGVLGGAGLSAPPPPAPAPTPAPASAPSGPLRVGGEVKPPHVIFAPQPEYPLLAKQARIQGVVAIEAIIDEHGNVIQVHAVGGPGVLIPAALKAVGQWKYEPTYLNGEPYPVSLTVEVTFHL